MRNKDINRYKVSKIIEARRAGKKRLADALFEDFIRINNALVAVFLKPFLNIDYVDNNLLYNVAYMVISNKINTFQPDLGFSFFTYVKRAIVCEIIKTIDKEYETIKIPYHVKSRLDRIRKRMKQSWADEFDLEAELREEFNVDDDIVRILQPLLSERTTYPLDFSRTSGINELYIPVEGTIESDKIHAFDLDIEDSFGCLNDKEEKIIRMRFGLSPYSKPHKLADIALEINMRPQTVSCKIRKILEKLRTAYTTR